MKIIEILKSVEEKENSAFYFSSSIDKNEKSILFENPARVYYACSMPECEKLFPELEKLKKEYLIAFIINYEAGYLFEDRFAAYLKNCPENLITACCYKRNSCRVFKKREIIMPGYEELNSLPDYKISNPRINVSENEYGRAFEKIKNYLSEGDIYQVNYTVKNKFDFAGGYAKLFLTLAANQSTKYSAFINLKGKMILSFSPELFFETDGKEIITRPMKGTAARGNNQYEDLEMKKWLSGSEKDKAENVMITDLLRNDLGRIAKFGTVKADNLFEIEKYESVFQMVSTIKAGLKENSLGEIIRNIFPCGSITGAPKIRAMEIIKELEKENRGIYTGAIGYADNECVKFNVAIRTLEIDKKTGFGEIGLGGGIVWDSAKDKEYKELLLKGAFVSEVIGKFQLIETILFENEEYFLFKEHLERLRTSAEYFLFDFEENTIIGRLKEISALFLRDKKYKVRLLLDKRGEMEISFEEINDLPRKQKALIAETRIDSKNKFQYFKTTNRKVYSEEYLQAAQSGYFDALFLNEKDQIAEGAITNIFVKIENQWLTPPVEAGILNGCYRSHFSPECKALEREMTLKDLQSADEVVLVNSVRKKVHIDEIWRKNSLIWKAGEGIFK